jgi:hypothetical protein
METSAATRRWSIRSRSRLLARDVQLYRLCDDLSGLVVCLMVVFSPWAFGTTQPWSIGTMNAGGYALGVLLAVKLGVRWVKGYRAPRWEPGEGNVEEKTSTLPARRGRPRLNRVAERLLAALTAMILAYTLTSALNARATYLPAQLSFEYHDYVKWLPHSLDSGRTWGVFWNYLALACAFWAARDWLLGRSDNETRAGHGRAPLLAAGRSNNAPLLPARLRTLLWLLALNGGLLGLEGIAQRLEGSGKLLFLVQPRVNPGAEAQFGPYAYRANAASYFNLVWPVCVGFWWTLHRSAGLCRATHHLLLVCAAIMAACPVISTSRGGAIVTAVILVAAAFLLLTMHFLTAASRPENRRGRVVAAGMVLLFCLGASSLGYSLGWKTIAPRMEQIREDFHGREDMFNRARPMAGDYPWFGTGPGTFESVFQLYRISADTYWPAQLHNDWLETRITFGWSGSLLVACAFGIVVLRWFIPGGIHGGRRFTALLWLAMVGCLLHARFDFPFQIYSILFLFLILCAVAMSLSRRGGHAGE